MKGIGIWTESSSYHPVRNCLLTSGFIFIWTEVLKALRTEGANPDSTPSSAKRYDSSDNRHHRCKLQFLYFYTQRLASTFKAALCKNDGGERTEIVTRIGKYITYPLCECEPPHVSSLAEVSILGPYGLPGSFCHVIKQKDAHLSWSPRTIFISNNLHVA